VAGAACLRQKEAGGELLDLWGRPELRLPGRPGLAGQGWVDVPAPLRMARNPLRLNEPTL
jgi:hypothetical protein